MKPIITKILLQKLYYYKNTRFQSIRKTNHCITAKLFRLFYSTTAKSKEGVYFSSLCMLIHNIVAPNLQNWF